MSFINDTYECVQEVQIPVLNNLPSSPTSLSINITYLLNNKLHTYGVEANKEILDLRAVKPVQIICLALCTQRFSKGKTLSSVETITYKYIRHCYR